MTKRLGRFAAFLSLLVVSAPEARQPTDLSVLEGKWVSECERTSESYLITPNRKVILGSSKKPIPATFYSAYQVNGDNTAAGLSLHYRDEIAQRSVSGYLMDNGKLLLTIQAKYKDDRIDRFLVCPYRKE